MKGDIYLCQIGLNGDNPQNELLAEMTYNQAKELQFMQK